MCRRAFIFVVLVVSGRAMPAQQLTSRGVPRPATAIVTATAVRADHPVVLDGSDRDDVWGRAQVIDQFRQYIPKDDADPTFRTEARVAYDDRNLFVFVRAWDPHPDSIMALLSRRDERTQSDYIRVVVDSYHDKRTGYEFIVNPAGVKRDLYLYNDSEEDPSWDAVWDVKTRVDSAGWTAEFRIPLSQLRFPRLASHTFGIGINREVGRLNERMAWPRFSRNAFGIASQLGEVQGIDGIGAPRRLEVLPYVVQKSSTEARADGYGHPLQTTVGADVKYGLTSNLTVDATVNPDFGQVEADPAVLNLSAFEQFYQEKRPFFLEGSGLFRYDISCNDGLCTGLFYSRRIGRAPQLSDLAPNTNDVPVATTILGAAKLTGRLSHGVSVGLLDAVTSRESAQDSITLEPRTNYLVGSLQKDFRNGLSGVSGVVTAVNRELDAESARFLRREAYTLGLESRHRFGPNNSYRLSLQGAASSVRGDAPAIALTQQGSLHLYQRPDDDLRYDSTRTSLGGTWGQLNLQKSGGRHTRFFTGVWASTPGFEINDVGFQSNANSRGWSNWFAFVFNEPHSFYRQLQLNVNQNNSWTPGGLLSSRGGNVNANATLKNQWFVSGGVAHEFENWCISCARGGPAMRETPSLSWWSSVTTDQRRAIFYALGVNGGSRDDGHSSNVSLGPSVTLRMASRFSTNVGLSFMRNIDDKQWLANFGAVASDTVHYTFAHLDQKLVSLTSRLDYTASPTLSVQLYAQPFLTSGDYSNWRELRDPHPSHYPDQLKPFTVQGDPGGFNYKEFRSNAVVRWEYRPGSTLYFVWSQGRVQDGRDVGSFDVRRDYRNLFSAHPNNTLLIKASYWFAL